MSTFNVILHNVNVYILYKALTKMQWSSMVQETNNSSLLFWQKIFFVYFVTKFVKFAG